MTTYYADTSVLIKRHIPETGSNWIISLTDDVARNRIITAQITHVEGISALNRRLREGTLNPLQYAPVVEDWAMACEEEYELVSLSPEVIVTCRRLLEAYSLRAYDAVQLASAFVTNQTLTARGRPPLVFLASDRRLLDAARGEGFAVDDPNLHP